MAEPFLSEIRVFSFNFAPRGWALCNGQIMPINQNQALFSLLGTTYGGDGRVTFALPNLQGRAPIHRGNGHTLGERGGEETHTLSIAEMPAHVHIAQASESAATTSVPTNNVLARASGHIYRAATQPTTLGPQALSNAGGSQPHPNMQPYTVVSFAIALQGIFPSPN